MRSRSDPRGLGELMELLREVVRVHRPELQQLLKTIGVSPLSFAAREALREALADELSARGLRGDDDPNEYGLRIEDAIDRMRYL